MNLILFVNDKFMTPCGASRSAQVIWMQWLLIFDMGRAVEIWPSRCLVLIYLIIKAGQQDRRGHMVWPYYMVGCLQWSLVGFTVSCIEYCILSPVFSFTCHFVSNIVNVVLLSYILQLESLKITFKENGVHRYLEKLKYIFRGWINDIYYFAIVLLHNLKNIIHEGPISLNSKYLIVILCASIALEYIM